METVQSPAARPAGGLDIGDVFTQGWRLFVDDIAALILGTLVAGLLSLVTLGILAGPLTAGLFDMVQRRVTEGRRPQFGDVFARLDRFWSFLGAALFLGVTIGLAFVTIIGGLLLATIWLYVFPLMLDRRLGFWEALRESQEIVVASGFWQHFVLVVILAVIASVANGALAIVATPFMIALIAVAYFKVTGRAADVAAS